MCFSFLLFVFQATVSNWLVFSATNSNFPQILTYVDKTPWNFFHIIKSIHCLISCVFLLDTPLLELFLLLLICKDSSPRPPS